MSDHIENERNYPNSVLNDDIVEFWNCLIDYLEHNQDEVMGSAANGSESALSGNENESMLRRRSRSAATRLRIVRYLSYFMCNLCSDCVRGGVVTICGHLFCWTCLWPELYDCNEPTCPRCDHLLTLHEDIVPFHGEGPNGSPIDASVHAQPGNVPRPSGLYLQDHLYPTWFWVHSFRGDMQFYLASERNLVTTRYQLNEQFSQGIEWMKYLQWFQVSCIFVICFLFYYLSSI